MTPFVGAFGMQSMAAARRGRFSTFRASLLRSAALVLAAVAVLHAVPTGWHRHAHRVDDSSNLAAVLPAEAPALKPHAASRRMAAASLLPVVLNTASSSAANAESSKPRPSPATKVVRSIAGVEMEIPQKWKTQVDQGPDRLIFSSAFWSSYTDFIAIRVEQIPMKQLLIGEQFIPSDEDVVANAWSTVIQPPITPESVATWIMRHKERPSLKVQGVNGKVLDPRSNQPGGGGELVLGADSTKENEIVDAVLTDGGAARGDEGSELLFHVRTKVFNKYNDENRYWTVKALLRNGLIYVAYMTAGESHFQPDAGPVDGPYCDSIVKSMRLLPPQA